VTAITGVVLVVIYGLQWLAGAFQDPLVLLALGANSPPLVQNGEWWRVVTGNLLHGGLAHIGFNLLAFFSFGRFLEPLLGSRFFTILFLASCLGGAAASGLFGSALISLGASTGVVGIVGAHVYLSWHFAEDRKKAAVSQGMWLFLVLVAPSVLIPNIDHFGHGGGLVVGMALTAWVIRLGPPKDRGAALGRRRLLNRVAAALVLLFAGTAAVTGVRFLTHGATPSAMALLRAPDLGRLPPEAEEVFVNAAAWTVAVDPAATGEQLATAAARMGWAEEGGEPAYLDTLASLHHRLGELDRAVELERRAFEGDRNPFHASQLARFELDRRRERGPIVGGLAGPPEVVPVRGPESDCPAGAELLLPPERRETPGLLVTDLGDPTAIAGQGLRLHLVLTRGERPAAFAVALLAPGAPPPLLTGLDPTLLACDVEPVVTRVETVDAAELSGEGEGAVEPVRWWLWPFSAEVAELP
jgi:rhomboid protease GluP